MKCLNVLAFILIVIGALNWGLWGFFQFDLVAWLFHGNTTWLSRLIYAIIGLAGVWSLRLIPDASICAAIQNAAIRQTKRAAVAASKCFLTLAQL